MQAAEEQAALYDRDLEATLADCVSRGDLEPLFEPVVDPVAREVIGYRSSVRGPFYSPLRLPDVLLDVARRSQVLASYGVVAREATVSAAAGLKPDDLLFLGCAAGELPNAAVVAVSEFYSLNKALVPQHVVFEIDADDLTTNTASTLRTLADVRDLGFLLCISGLGAQFTALELIAEAAPRLPVPRPDAGRRSRRRPHADRGRAAAGALRRPHRRAAHRDRACATRSSSRCWRATGSSCSAARPSRAPTRGCREVTFPE